MDAVPLPGPVVVVAVAGSCGHRPGRGEEVPPPVGGGGRGGGGRRVVPGLVGDVDLEGLRRLRPIQPVLF